MVFDNDVGPSSANIRPKCMPIFNPRNHSIDLDWRRRKISAEFVNSPVKIRPIWGYTCNLTVNHSAILSNSERITYHLSG